MSGFDPSLSDVNNGGGLGPVTKTVGTTAILAAVGSSNELDRQELIVQNISKKSIYWGLTNSVTASGANQGFELEKGQIVTFPYGELTSVYLIAASSGNDVKIAEVR